MAKRQKDSVFQSVNYREFRQHLECIATGKVKEKGFETVIYDQQGRIQAIVHAASIDADGNCYPAEYFVMGQALEQNLLLAA